MTWSLWGPLTQRRSTRKVAALARPNKASAAIARGDRVFRTGIARTSPTLAATKIAGFEIPIAGGPSAARPQRNPGPLGRPEPLHGQRDQPQGHEEVGRIRLHLAAVADGRVSDRQDRDREHQRHALQQPARDVAEQEQARDRGDRGQESQRPLAEPERQADRLLRPEEERGADLRVVQRPRQAHEIAFQDVQRQVRLVVPEREIQAEPEQPQRDPEPQEDAEPSPDATVGPPGLVAPPEPERRRSAGEGRVILSGSGEVGLLVPRGRPVFGPPPWPGGEGAARSRNDQRQSGGRRNIGFARTRWDRSGRDIRWHTLGRHGRGWGPRRCSGFSPRGVTRC